MGDIAFNINKSVDLNKTVDLEINKNVDVNVNIDGQLATAEADAEAFGSPALAEVDAYTFVTESEAFAYAESTAALDGPGDIPPPPPNFEPGGMQIVGNSTQFTLPVSNLDVITDLPSSTTALLGLAPLYVGPVSEVGDFELTSTSPDTFTLDGDVLINFGSINGWVDYDGDSSTLGDREDVTGQDMILRIPADSVFNITDTPPPGTNNSSFQLASGTPGLELYFEGGTSGVISGEDLTVSASFLNVPNNPLSGYVIQFNTNGEYWGPSTT